MLNFGRKKSDKFSFPIIFRDEKKAFELYDELIKLKGQNIDEVRKSCAILFAKYKKFDYRKYK